MCVCMCVSACLCVCMPACVCMSACLHVSVRLHTPAFASHLGALTQQPLMGVPDPWPGLPCNHYLWQIIANHHMQSISFASGGDTVRRG